MKRALEKTALMVLICAALFLVPTLSTSGRSTQIALNAEAQQLATTQQMTLPITRETTMVIDEDAHPRYATHPQQNFGILRLGDRTHVAYMDSHLRILIRTFDHKRGDWTGPSTLLGIGDQEQHYPNMAIDKEGFIHVIWGGHGGPTPLRYRMSLRPNDCSDWRIAEEPVADLSAAYPKIIVDRANYTYLFYRVSPPRSTFPEGPWSIAYVRKRLGSATWEPPVSLVTDNQENMPNSVSVQMIGSRLGIIWIWNNRTDTSLRNNRNISIAFRNEAGWSKTDGTPYSLPISFRTAEHVYSGFVYRAGSLVQQQSRPLIFFNTVEPLQLVLARYHNGSWIYLTFPNLYIGQFGVDTVGRVHGVVTEKNMTGLAYMCARPDLSLWELGGVYALINSGPVRYPIVAPQLTDYLEAAWPQGGRLVYFRATPRVITATSTASVGFITTSFTPRKDSCTDSIRRRRAPRESLPPMISVGGAILFGVSASNRLYARSLERSLACIPSCDKVA